MSSEEMETALARKMVLEEIRYQAQRARVNAERKRQQWRTAVPTSPSTASLGRLVRHLEAVAESWDLADQLLAGGVQGPAPVCGLGSERPANCVRCGHRAFYHQGHRGCRFPENPDTDGRCPCYLAESEADDPGMVQDWGGIPQYVETDLVTGVMYCNAKDGNTAPCDSQEPYDSAGIRRHLLVVHGVRTK